MDESRTCRAEPRSQFNLTGNVGIVSGIFSPQNGRHTDVSAPCRRHDTDHVGDIAQCRLVGCRVGVVSACRLPDMLAHNGGGGNVMKTMTTAVAAETQQSNRHGRGGGMVTAMEMATSDDDDDVGDGDGDSNNNDDDDDYRQQTTYNNQLNKCRLRLRLQLLLDY